MRWIEHPTEYRKLRDTARGCVDIDSDRYDVPLRRLTYHDIASGTDEFAVLLQVMMELAEEDVCYYMILDPDPEYFWKDRLGRYAVFEMNRGDSTEDYIRFLNEPFNSRQGGDMGTMWYDYVIFSPGLKWFAHAIRSDRDDTGHLWIPSEWIEEAKRAYPWLT